MNGRPTVQPGPLAGVAKTMQNLQAYEEAEAGGALSAMLQASHAGYVRGYTAGFEAGEREGSTSQPRRNLFTGACWGAAVTAAVLGGAFFGWQ